MYFNFNFSKTPKILFGRGTFKKLPQIVSEFGNSILFVTGSYSYKHLPNYNEIVLPLKEKSTTYHHVTICGEPSPEMIDKAVKESPKVDVIVAIGGGSAIDSGKAISAMLPLPHGESVIDYLEGVGNKNHNGNKIPFIAIPTTAGTGSETTKNAVLSKPGPDGFKKSLRHDNFVPDIAIVDPELMLKCKSNVTASCGMDAFTQLFEAYVSTKANPMIDSLVERALKDISRCIIPAYTEGSTNIDAREGMAYGAMISGIALANAGLGIVHGLASPLGGFFDIHHGIACGTLIGSAIKTNLRKLDNKKKFARAGSILCGIDESETDLCCDLLVNKVDGWIETLQLPRLSRFGVEENHIEKIIDSTDNKNNPVNLDNDDIREILMRRL